MADDKDPVDPVLEVLTEYEERLRVLHQNDQLNVEGARTFESLVTELERRTGRDRRGTARPGPNRRSWAGEPLLRR
jgi:hypothetical protein